MTNTVFAESETGKFLASENFVPAGTLRVLEDAAGKVGISADPLLRLVGIDPMTPLCPMTPMPIRDVARTFARGVAVSQCEHFSALAGDCARLRNSGNLMLLLMEGDETAPV